MSDWTIAKDGELCGYDGQRVPEGEPLQLVGPSTLSRGRRLKRCQAHAFGPVNWRQVDQAKFVQETQAERVGMADERRADPEPEPFDAKAAQLPVGERE